MARTAATRAPATAYRLNFTGAHDSLIRSKYLDRPSRRRSGDDLVWGDGAVDAVVAPGYWRYKLDGLQQVHESVNACSTHVAATREIGVPPPSDVRRLVNCRPSPRLVILMVDVEPATSNLS
jgi:hypothetical protein